VPLPGVSQPRQTHQENQRLYQPDRTRHEQACNWGETNW
jgi:hypothetical protein